MAIHIQYSRHQCGLIHSNIATVFSGTAVAVGLLLASPITKSHEKELHLLSPPNWGMTFYSVALGFEPREPFSSTAFKAVAINHSAKLPYRQGIATVTTPVKCSFQGEVGVEPTTKVNQVITLLSRLKLYRWATLLHQSSRRSKDENK